MVLHFAHQDVLDPMIALSCRQSRVAADTRVSLTWLRLSRGDSEARLRLNASSGPAFSADTEVWFTDGRTVDDYLALFRRNNGVRREARVPEGTQAGDPD
jgi:hypothetical protein